MAGEEGVYAAAPGKAVRARLPLHLIQYVKVRLDVIKRRPVWYRLPAEERDAVLGSLEAQAAADTSLEADADAAGSLEGGSKECSPGHGGPGAALPHPPQRHLRPLPDIAPACMFFASVHKCKTARRLEVRVASKHSRRPPGAQLQVLRALW